jgi:hypothetical protein
LIRILMRLTIQIITSAFLIGGIAFYPL